MLLFFLFFSLGGGGGGGGGELGQVHCHLSLSNIYNIIPNLP